MMGPTYTSRLWCVVELFVFVTMGGKLEDVEVIILSETPEEQTKIIESFDTFDARLANCFDPADANRLLEMIEAGFGKCVANRVV
jgi:hypothetical protein